MRSQLPPLTSNAGVSTVTYWNGYNTHVCALSDYHRARAESRPNATVCESHPCENPQLSTISPLRERFITQANRSSIKFSTKTKGTPSVTTRSILGPVWFKRVTSANTVLSRGDNTILHRQPNESNPLHLYHPVAQLRHLPLHRSISWRGRLCLRRRRPRIVSTSFRMRLPRPRRQGGVGFPHIIPALIRRSSSSPVSFPSLAWYGGTSTSARNFLVGKRIGATRRGPRERSERNFVRNGGRKFCPTSRFLRRIKYGISTKLT